MLESWFWWISWKHQGINTQESPTEHPNTSSLFQATYLLVWGEAGNLRFMPEAIYFLTELALGAEGEPYQQPQAHRLRQVKNEKTNFKSRGFLGPIDFEVKINMVEKFSELGI